MGAPRVGDIVAGRYEVERVLGKGAMGIVVAARNVNLREQRVAIKFLLDRTLLRPDLIARFLREGNLAAMLRSEHITRIHDVGTLASGEPFLVMEYLDGRDLGAVVEANGTLGIETAVGYVLQVCEALAEAHARGIVHRDLKPANLVLTRRADGSPLIKVIDFGIAKPPPDDPGVAEPGTASTTILGTPQYMAPEQMRSTREVDSRADIWALGVILHKLITGEAPFQAQDFIDVYDLILLGAPPLRSRRSDAPAELEAVLLRCLQQDPAQRYADIGELAAALAELGPPEGRSAAHRAQSILRRGPHATMASSEAVDDERVEKIDPRSSVDRLSSMGARRRTASSDGGSETSSRAAATWGGQGRLAGTEPATALRPPGLITTPGRLLDILDRAYDIHQPTRSWLEGVTDALRPGLEQGGGILAFLLNTRDDQRPPMQEPVPRGIGELWREWFEQMSSMPREILAQARAVPPLLYKSHFTIAAMANVPAYRMYVEHQFRASLLAAPRDAEEILARDEAQGLPWAECLALHAGGPTGNDLLFVAPCPRRARALPTSTDLDVWGRVTAHLASAHRLHVLVQDLHLGPLQGAEAILSPDGRVESAEGPAQDRSAQLVLREAVHRMDRARTRREGRSPGEAVDLWRALVAGRWSLVDEVDTDGRRFVVARRNDPGASAAVLSDRERQVAAHLALGHSNTLIAYQLGVARSTVSSCAARLGRKLGATSRRELVARCATYVSSLK
jgi:serine/threonine-protein kinase